MNKSENDLQNKQLYQQTFDEIHASPELLGKVNDMKNTNNNSKFKKISRIGCSLAAALALCFIFSNVITYAATGSSWIHNVIVRINGEEQSVDMLHKTDTNGNGYYEITLPVEDTETTIELIGDGTEYLHEITGTVDENNTQISTTE